MKAAATSLDHPACNDELTGIVAEMNRRFSDDLKLEAKERASKAGIGVRRRANLN
jgi:hypothetical protein